MAGLCRSIIWMLCSQSKLHYCQKLKYTQIAFYTTVKWKFGNLFSDDLLHLGLCHSLYPLQPPPPPKKNKPLLYLTMEKWVVGRGATNVIRRWCNTAAAIAIAIADGSRRACRRPPGSEPKTARHRKWRCSSCRLTCGRRFGRWPVGTATVAV